MNQEKIKLSADGIRETKPSEWAVRFIFGGFVSVVAALIGEKWGPVIGGLFLGFPSILPATVTLIKKHDNRSEACHDANGAALGSFGLAVFAMITYFTLELWPLPVVLTVATLAWGLTSFLVWFAIARIFSS